MVSVNERAARIIERMIERKGLLGVGVRKLQGGTKVVDAGIESKAGFRAARNFTEVCLGGLGEVSFAVGKRLCVNVSVDYPVIACMASQYAGWRIKVGDYFAMGSGPARALSQVEDIFDELDYADDSEIAAIALETREFPGEEVADFIAEKSGVKPENLYVIVAPTASIVGSVQIPGRVVETGIHKLHELDFDLEKIMAGAGSAPVAPVADSDLEAMGRTNDCILYGGRTVYFVDAEDSEIEDIIDDIPSSSSEDYGEPFLDIFESYDRDFYKIDAKLFSPAEVVISNVRTGRVFHAGEINEKVLVESLGV